MTSYIAYLRKDRDSAYGVEFPDLPGCTGAGGSMEEAKAMATEAIAVHVAVLQDRGEPVLAPSTMDQLALDPHRGDAVLFLVDLDPAILKFAGKLQAPDGIDGDTFVCQPFAPPIQLSMTSMASVTCTRSAR